MSTKKKLLQAAAGAAGGAETLNVENVFSTYLYEGNASSSGQTITNGIDLSGEGGLVWIKNRDYSSDHVLYDTERGISTKTLSNNYIAESYAAGQGVTSFNSDGFTLTTGDNDYNAAASYTSWTFRKTPKFFDVVTWTGDGTNGRTISHNLGTTVGSIFVKRRDATAGWYVYHRHYGGTHSLFLNGTLEAQQNTNYWNDTDATSTEFTVASNTGLNASGGTYVAYLFAHHNNDGEFGPDADQDIIKCGSYTGADSYKKITLGFEPQWLLIKGAAGTYAGSTSWMLIDNMRSGSGGRFLYANSNASESSGDYPQERITFEGDGFSISDNNSNLNRSSHTYVYIAIRDTPMIAPSDAADVFAMDVHGSAGDSSAPAFRSGWPVDMSIRRNIASSDDWDIGSRLLQGKYLRTNSNVAETSESSELYDFMNGWWNSPAVNNNLYGWMWRSAPSFFDVVTYTGNGSFNGKVVNHNLGVAPEMMWIKRRDTSADWAVYSASQGVTKYNQLNSSAFDTDPLDAYNRGSYWRSTTPTSTSFTLGIDNRVNAGNGTYVGYLFASLPGVSKLGSYTGDGTNDGSKVIDCGFSAGARFVLIKRTDNTGNWMVFDTERGITTGDDSILRLNINSAAGQTNQIDPHSSGFKMGGQSSSFANISGAQYIFYAIA